MYRFLPSLCIDHCYSKPTSDVMKEYFTEIQDRKHGEVNTEYKLNDCTAKPSTRSRLTATPLSVLGELPYPVKVVVHTTHTVANKLVPGNTLYLTVFKHLLAMLLAYQMSREILHTALKYNVQFQTPSVPVTCNTTTDFTIASAVTNICKTQLASLVYTPSMHTQ